MNVQTYARKNWLWLAVNLAVLATVAWLIGLIMRAPSSSGVVLFDSSPTRDVVIFSGKAALILLVASLACTPLARVGGFRRTATVRKSLGLWAIGFAAFHAIYLLGGKAIFYDVAAWQGIWNWAGNAFLFGAWGKMPYAQAGIFALVLLIPLALTSTRRAMRLLGKNWKRLHRLVYLAVPVAVWHYGWRVYHRQQWSVPNGDGSSGTSELWQPIFFAGVVGALLLVRVPSVRKFLVSTRTTAVPHKQTPSAPA